MLQMYYPTTLRVRNSKTPQLYVSTTVQLSNTMTKGIAEY